MNYLLDVVRALFDPLVEALGFSLFSWLTLSELVACAAMVAAYEVFRQLNSEKWRHVMQMVSGALVPLLLLAVALIIYRFDYLA